MPRDDLRELRLLNRWLRTEPQAQPAGVAHPSPGVPVIGWDLDRFQRDILLDSLQEATAIYWERRADQLATALPRPTDRPGNQPTDVRSLQATITACRNHASLLRGL